jgi:hypothetical protein
MEYRGGVMNGKELERLWGLFRAAMDKPIVLAEMKRRANFVYKKDIGPVTRHGFLCFLEGYEASKREAKETGSKDDG